MLVNDDVLNALQQGKKMRRVILFSIFLASLLMVACETKTPNIVLEIDEIKLGDVVNGAIVKQDVEVRNDGESPLVVEAISTSCGCTQASMEPMQIDPGATGILHIEFDSGAHGPDLTGPLMRQVFINSNDPNQPEAQISVSANIIPSTTP